MLYVYLAIWWGLTATAFYLLKLERSARRDAQNKALRYWHAADDLDRWCGYEIPQARVIAAHIKAHGEGLGYNCGTPAANEPCDISGLRDQLRRLKTPNATNSAGSAAAGAGPLE